MKRREFITAAAGIGTGAVVMGVTTPAKAQPSPSAAPERFQIYKCNECGTILEILVAGEMKLSDDQTPGDPMLLVDQIRRSGRMEHCGRHMELLEAKTKEEGREKHVPVVERIRGGYRVAVGSVAHPMLEVHYISMIQLIVEEKGCLYTKLLKPGDKPEAVFVTDAYSAMQDYLWEMRKRGVGREMDTDTVVARAYCNKHGLWQGK